MAANRRITAILTLIAIPASIPILLAIGLRIAGLLIPFRIPTATMAPTIRVGDCVLMEGVTYLRHAPRRGDVLVFGTKSIPALPDGTYVKRLVGLPGDRLRIKNGQLYVNDREVVFRASDGSIIRYLNGGALQNPSSEVIVPPDGFFVLGDNSANSADSRYWGAVPKGNVRGKVWFRYWPPLH
jgi:signal peptidase I